MTVDELVDRARPLASNGRVPSKTALRTALRVSWDKASEVHRTLNDEHQRRLSERATKRRTALTRMRGQKGSGRGLRRRPDPSTGIPVSPAVTAMPPVTVPQVNATMYGVVPVAATPVQKPPARPRSWPLLLLTLPAFVSIWAGWVDLGRLTGFGVVHPLPGIADDVALNTAITLPVGLETYAGYALYVWLSAAVPASARQFAKWSAVGSLVLGFAGQAVYHLMIAAGVERAPWWITLPVSGVPVAVLGMGAALRHLVHAGEVSE